LRAATTTTAFAVIDVIVEAVARVIAGQSKGFVGRTQKASVLTTREAFTTLRRTMTTSAAPILHGHTVVSSIVVITIIPL
jgi:hypothetical protein